MESNENKESNEASSNIGDNSTDTGTEKGQNSEDTQLQTGHKRNVARVVTKEVEIAHYVKRTLNTITALAEKISEVPDLKSKILEEQIESINNIREMFEKIISA